MAIHHLKWLNYVCSCSYAELMYRVVFDLLLLSEGEEFDVKHLQMSNAQGFAWPPKGGGNKW
jgi:hypothetical protein